MRGVALTLPEQFEEAIAKAKEGAAKAAAAAAGEVGSADGKPQPPAGPPPRTRLRLTSLVFVSRSVMRRNLTDLSRANYISTGRNIIATLGKGTLRKRVRPTATPTSHT